MYICHILPSTDLIDVLHQTEEYFPYMIDGY